MKMICRICLSEIKAHDSLLLADYASFIMFCTNVKIGEDDEKLPKSICQACAHKAKTAYDFKVVCEKSDIQLRQNKKILSLKNEVSELVGKFIQPLENNKKKLKCRSFKYKRALQEREEEEYEEDFTCKDYDVSAKQLAIHVSVKKMKGSHLCHLCGKAYTLPENLKRHQRVHDNVRPFSCEICDKSFTQSNELKSHLISHSSEKKFLCSFCGHTYARENSLQVHITRIHKSVSKPYICTVCGRAFKGLVDMRIHRTIHTGRKNHVCKVCNKGFNKSSNLKVHEMIHTGQRPFACHICQKSFIQKHVLKKHLAVHSDSRPLVSDT